MAANKVQGSNPYDLTGEVLQHQAMNKKQFRQAKQYSRDQQDRLNTMKRQVGVI